jgi:hypothetical protein
MGESNLEWWRTNAAREGGDVMAAQQGAIAMDRPSTTSPPLEMLPPGRPTAPTEPRWLLSSAECRQIRPVADAFVLVTGLQGCLEPWKL